MTQQLWSALADGITHKRVITASFVGGKTSASTIMYNYEEMIGFRNVKKSSSGKGNGATDNLNYVGGTLKGKSTNFTH